ncbi:MAG: hypothetical protein QXW36_02780 [Desulfurococcaceae archaeon]
MLIATAIHNRAMPLIRYKLDDYTGYKGEDHSYGINLPIVYPIETKLKDFLIIPNERITLSNLITFQLKTKRRVIESQVVQKNIDKILVKVVVFNDRFNEEELIEEMKEILGNEVEIKIQYVHSIYPSASFKNRFVVSKLDKELIHKELRRDPL